MILNMNPDPCIFSFVVTTQDAGGRAFVICRSLLSARQYNIYLLKALRRIDIESFSVI